jgi:hypothetical protein
MSVLHIIPYFKTIPINVRPHTEHNMQAPLSRHSIISTISMLSERALVLRGI